MAITLAMGILRPVVGITIPHDGRGGTLRGALQWLHASEFPSESAMTLETLVSEHESGDLDLNRPSIELQRRIGLCVNARLSPGRLFQPQI